MKPAVAAMKPGHPPFWILAGALGGAVAALADVAFALGAGPSLPVDATLLLLVTALSLCVCGGGALGTGVALALWSVGERRRLALAEGLADTPQRGFFTRLALAGGSGIAVVLAVGAPLAARALEARSTSGAALAVALAVLLGAGVCGALWRVLRRVSLWGAPLTLALGLGLGAGALWTVTRDGGPLENIDPRPFAALLVGVCATLGWAIFSARRRPDARELLGGSRPRSRVLPLRFWLPAAAASLSLLAFSLLYLGGLPDVRAASETAALTGPLLDRVRGALGLDTADGSALADLASRRAAQAAAVIASLAPPAGTPTVGADSPVARPTARQGDDGGGGQGATALVGAGGRPRQHVILLTVDALRADHLGLYGYARGTSPELDAFAKNATVFERAYSQETKTKGSIPSLFTSRWPSDIRWGGRRYVPLSDHESTLPERLLEAGYHTAAFVTHSYFLPSQGMDRGFVHYDTSLISTNPAIAFGQPSGAALANRVIDYLGRVPKERPFFLWAHFFDPHERYLTHPGFSRFGGRAMDRYDGEIAYSDHHLGRVLRAIDAHPERDRITVIVTADHGEAFGEHGRRFHGSTLYEEELRVPLLMRVPGATPRREATPVALVDVVPTVFELAGLPPSADHRGRSLLSAVGGTPLPLQPVYAEILPEDRHGARSAVIHGPWKLLYDERRNLLRLYNLKDDPRERINRLRQDALVASELASMLFKWRARQVPLSPAPLAADRTQSRTLTP